MATAPNPRDLVVLGIETSCDETAAALVRREASGKGVILANVVRSQLALHAEFGVKRKLRAHRVGEDDALAVRLAPDQGGGGLVAARLDAKHDEVAPVGSSSHDASLQGKTGAVEEYDAFLSI